MSDDKPDPAAMDMGYMMERLRDGMSAADALESLIAYKRTLSPDEYSAMMRQYDDAQNWMQAELNNRPARPAAGVPPARQCPQGRAGLLRTRR